MKVEEFNKNLDNIQQTANELSGTHEIPFAEIFSAEFMQKYSDMDTFDDFLKAGNFCINYKKDWENIPDIQLDKHVKQYTDFSTWADMLTEATQYYLMSKLQF